MFVYENESGISTRKEPGLQLTFLCLLYSPDCSSQVGHTVGENPE